MTTILQVSDLHFGPPYLPRVGAAVLEAAAKLQPDVVVASGDFTQRARPEEFRAARKFLDALPDVPLVVTPGNHDVPALPSLQMLWAPFEEYQRHIRRELDFELRTDELVLVSLNSTTWAGSLLNGRISQAQLDYCARVFRDVPAETLKVVVAHHHFAPAPTINGDENVMRKAKRAIELFTELKVDVVMGGHKHRAYIGNSLDFYAGPVREHGIIIVQCGTTTSRRGRSREREKNTFNVLRSENGTLRISQYMYFKEVDRFEVIGEHLYPRAEAKFVPQEDAHIQSLGEKL